MTEYPYVELTAASMMGLAKARDHFGAELGEDRLARIEKAMREGERYLRDSQRADGSWEGSWAVCFIYGTWFGISGLRAAGVDSDDPAIKRAVAAKRASTCSTQTAHRW
jgi:squalene cyclase